MCIVQMHLYPLIVDISLSLGVSAWNKQAVISVSLPTGCIKRKISLINALDILMKSCRF